LIRHGDAVTVIDSPHVTADMCQGGMMRRRRRSILALFTVAALLAVPAVHWRLIGWVRGEAFYQGRPTSYWARELRSFRSFPVGCSFETGAFPRPLKDIVRSNSQPGLFLRPKGIWSWILVRLDFPFPFPCEITSESAEDLFPHDDATAVPVLTELLDNPDTNVTWFAAWRLKGYGAEAIAAIPALRRATNSPHRDTALLAAALLEDLDPSTAGVLERLWKAEPRTDLMPVRVSGAVKAGGG
jgi:hypothetical protein